MVSMKKDEMARKAFLMVLLFCISMTEAGRLPISYKRMKSATSSPDPAPPTAANGCEWKGKLYPFGAKFGEGYDAKENWCYGYLCDKSGNVLTWDNFKCRKQPTTTSPPPPTPPPTTPTPPPSCTVNGKEFPINSDIDSGYDEGSDWCYGSYCSEEGQVIHWDRWNCKKSSTPSTTTPAAPTTPVSTPPVNLSLWKSLLKFLRLHHLFGKKP